MSWQVEFRPEVREDVAEAVRWYEAREPGLGGEFVEEIIQVWDAIAANSLIGSRRHPVMDIRWRYPERFPYRVIYRVDEVGKSNLVIAVLHGARHESSWRGRV